MPDRPMDENARHGDVAHEKSDIRVAAVAITGVVSAVTAIVMVGAVFGVTELFRRTDAPVGPEPTAIERMDIVPPEPRLLADPDVSLARLRAREREILHSYGWLDPARSRARIPIERAEALMVGRALDVPPP